MAEPKPSLAEKVEQRVRELLAEWEYHRGALPQPIVDGLVKLRDAVRAADAKTDQPRTETSRRA
jgi:hypothetical protein